MKMSFVRIVVTVFSILFFFSLSKLIFAAPTTSHAYPNRQQQLWALAADALLTERNGEKHDSLAGMERTATNIRLIKDRIRDSWDINSRSDLLDTLKWLEQGGHRAEFEEMGKQVSSMSATERQRYEHDVQVNNRTLLQKVIVVEANYAKLGKKSLIAWDYARYISLCRYGYTVGYLSKQEAWQKIMPAAIKLQSTYSSWLEIGENYLIGYDFWATGNRLYYQRVRTAFALNCLRKNKNSPWNTVPWNVNLAK